LVKKSEEEDENGEDHFTTSDQKWTAVGQTNYTIDKASPNYIYGNASYEDDRFSSFDNQSSISAGWGRRWYETEKTTLDADIGPGFKRDVVSATDTDPEEINTAFIVQAQALYTRELNEHVLFKQLFVAKYAPKSDANSTYKARTSISTKLLETLQLKFSFTVDYNTDVDEDKENVNTETAMTLVYSF
jgi:putative salt-induced outer membrane protein YdiY